MAKPRGQDFSHSLNKACTFSVCRTDWALQSCWREVRDGWLVTGLCLHGVLPLFCFFTWGRVWSSNYFNRPQVAGKVHFVNQKQRKLFLGQHEVKKIVTQGSLYRFPSSKMGVRWSVSGVFWWNLGRIPELNSLWLSPLTLWQVRYLYSHFVDKSAEPQKLCDLFKRTQFVVGLGLRGSWPKFFQVRLCLSCTLCPDNWLLFVIQMFPPQMPPIHLSVFITLSCVFSS